ncbi:NAD(P)/FAD-dependent oxidoreductase [Malikia spinosa]|nr:NAD(P)/FAD-dependent oxidoreductase [Malikia spinosa]
MLMALDVAIIGAGAAGLFCAGVAGQLGLRVLLLDHAPKVAEKIRISGGGRCNFTNRELDPRQPHKHFLGDNPNFCRSALSRYTPADFIELLQRHALPFHEKHKGQLFCDRSAQDLIELLLKECEAGGVQRWQPCAVQAVSYSDADPSARYQLQTDRGPVACRSLVVATGGLSIPKIGASDFGFRLARQFGLNVIELRPALVPLTFDAASWAPFSELSGLALPVRIATGDKKAKMEFLEDLLFTHRGLSGPAVLQISSYWRPGQPLRLDLHPESALEPLLLEAKTRSRKLLANELSLHLPSRLADTWTAQQSQWQRPVNDTPDKAIAQLAQGLQRWELTPTGTEGYAKAEVTAGGVDTRQLSSQTMESKQPGLHFIGEVVDVTGWLGGYNFQWAWSSAHACAQALAADRLAAVSA